MPDPASLKPYLLVSAFLFATGVLACATRRSAIGVLIGLELMFNAAALNAVAYGRFLLPAGALEGQGLALFVIVVAAAEAALALALLYAVYRSRRDVDLEDAVELRS